LAKKTLQDHAEDALYREVGEELAAQKIRDFLKRHAKMLIISAVLAVAATASIVIARQMRMSSMMEAAAQYESAMDMAPQLSREALSRLARSTRGGMADQAMFRAYQLAMGSNDRADALSKLEYLAEKGATRDFRDLAVVQIALIKGDSLSADALQKMMSPVLSKRSPFYFTGLLITAEKYLSEGKKAEAKLLLKKITSDKDAPISVLGTAEMLSK
jgi:hypothetical protein